MIVDVEDVMDSLFNWMLAKMSGNDNEKILKKQAGEALETFVDMAIEDKGKNK
jgi:hypothetical protein|tara:strand:+ start:144 stop:302 length:159 start_codon:yes stop_codon:yes gene_type:complete